MADFGTKREHANYLAEKFAPHSEMYSPLIFVFLGMEFPDYAEHSLKLAAKTAKVPIVVLSNCSRPRKLSQTIIWIDVDCFYNKSDFAEFESKTSLPKGFRDGFWLKTAERFFVLRDFMRVSNIRSFFHGELDCLFFDLFEVDNAIRESGFRGVFLPRETHDRVIASLVFFNDQNSIDELCKFILGNVHLGNEMEILGALPFDSSGFFFSLPSTEYLYREKLESNQVGWPVVPTNPGFIVDGAVMGRWLFGVDPRNTGGRGTRNRIQNQKHAVPFALPLKELSFRRLKRDGWSLYVSRNDLSQSKRLSVLHVHSKVHRKITLRYVDRILNRLSRGKPTRIVPVHRSFIALIFGRIARQGLRTLRSKELMALTLRNLRSSEWRGTLIKRLIRL